MELLRTSYILVLMIMCFPSCDNKIKTTMLYAGNNAKELERVLEYFKNDPVTTTIILENHSATFISYNPQNDRVTYKDSKGTGSCSANDILNVMYKKE